MQQHWMIDCAMDWFLSSAILGKNQTGPWGEKSSDFNNYYFTYFASISILAVFLVVQQIPPYSDCKVGHQTEGGA